MWCEASQQRQMKGMFFYDAHCKERVPRVWPMGHVKPLLPVKDHLCFAISGMSRRLSRL